MKRWDWGAVLAGVRFVSGYPGTPSTEALKTIAKWPVNKKAAMEAAEAMKALPPPCFHEINERALSLGLERGRQWRLF